MVTPVRLPSLLAALLAVSATHLSVLVTETLLVGDPNPQFDAAISSTGVVFTHSSTAGQDVRLVDG